MRWLTFFTITTLFAGIAAGGVKNVAVVETELDKESGAKPTKAEIRLVTAELRREAVNNLPRDKYNIMTSETVIAQGSAFAAECNEENCVIAFGSKIGADYVVYSTISKLQTKLTLSVEIFDTEDGNLVASLPTPVRADNITALVEKGAAACGVMFRGFANPQSYMQQIPIIPQTAVSASSSVNQTTAPTYQSHVPSYQPSGGGGSGAFADKRDGKTYKTVIIGGKTWMSENLNYKIDNSWCYGNHEPNCGKYGRLYDWNTAKTVCPSGWHLPTRQEWDNLVAAAGGSFVAGVKLKAKGGWKGNANTTDDYGFSALPGGYRLNANGGFNNADYYGYWWTATENNSGSAYNRYMDYGNSGVREYNDGKSHGFSVRCLQDNAPIR